MKFGRTIKTSLYSEWSSKYLRYSDLKKFIKKRIADNNGRWTEEDEDAAEKDDEETSDELGQSRRVNNHVEKAAADNLRDAIASQMWRSYQEELKLRRLQYRK